MRAALLAAAVLAAGCGGASHATAQHAPPAQAACADHLPLDTLLRVPAGPSRPRPLILALHGARQSGYGLQS